MEAGESYRLQLLFPDGYPVDGSWTLWSGDNCGGLIEHQTWEHYEVPVDLTFTATGSRVWVSFDGPVFSAFCRVYYQLDPA